MTALEIYNKTKLSSVYLAEEIIEELRSARVEESLIPAALYEAGMRSSKAKDPELCKTFKAISNYTRAERNREAMIKLVDEIRAAAASGGYNGDPVFDLFEGAYCVLASLAKMEAVQ